jgi:hypothetical protein
MNKEFTSTDDKMVEAQRAETLGFECTFDHEIVAYKAGMKFILLADGWHHISPVTTLARIQKDKP